jgi:hypothetical protein
MNIYLRIKKKLLFILIKIYLIIYFKCSKIYINTLVKWTLNHKDNFQSLTD